jgi:hypothetical protein
VSRSLLEVLRNVTLDPGEHAAFSADPAGYLAQHGYEDVPAEHLAEAFSLVADTLPADVARTVSPTLLGVEETPGGGEPQDGDLLLADDLSLDASLPGDGETAFGAVNHDFDDDTAGADDDTAGADEDLTGAEATGDTGGEAAAGAEPEDLDDFDDLAGSSPGEADLAPDASSGAGDALSAGFGFGEGSEAGDGGFDDLGTAASPAVSEDAGGLEDLDSDGPDLAGVGTEPPGADFGTGGDEVYGDDTGDLGPDHDAGSSFADPGDEGGFDIDDVGAF